MARDYVDIGNTSADPGAEQPAHNMSSWSIPLPGPNGGSYGGIAPGSCRAIWSSQNDNSTTAFITLDFAAGTETLWLKHLEGIANDAFDVFVNGVRVYQHFENSQVERWLVHFVLPPVPGGFPAGQQVVEFVATGPAWDSFDLFGQVCFDEVWIGLEEPVAIQEGSWGEVKALFR